MVTYIACLKTTQSELRALKNIDGITKQNLLPLIELTMSRRTNKLPEGSRDRSLDSFVETYGSKLPFILDITTEDSLRNSELEELYDSTGGYEKWVKYLETLRLTLDFSPVILLNIEEDLRQLSIQAINIAQSFDKYFLRLPIVDLTHREALDICDQVLTSKGSEKAIIILDGGFIGQEKSISFSASILEIARAIKGRYGRNSFYVLSSSFPKTVTSSGYGDAKTGEFPIAEIKLLETLKAQAPDIEWLYADYGTVHPIRYQTKGGVWVPRVDVPLDDKIFYHRYRREEGGYRKATMATYEDKRFDNTLKCWGIEQIRSGAEGKPPGLNPSFWISVRINIHLKRQAQRLLRI